MKPIAIFYHCLLFTGEPPSLSQTAFNIVRAQMAQLSESGLAEVASEIVIGINGGQDNLALGIAFPEKAKIVLHGHESRSELPTLVLLEQWISRHLGWHVLYFHTKGATHPIDDVSRPELGMSPADYFHFVAKWRNCMMDNLVNKWNRCVADLDSGYDSVGCHWMPNAGVNKRDNIWGGNFWWAASDFLSTLPPIMTLNTVKRPDLGSRERAYEAEHWIGEGSKLPVVKDYHPGGVINCP